MMTRSCSRCRSTVLVLLPQKTKTMMISLVKKKKKKKKKRRGFVSARKTRTPKPPLASGYPRTARLVSSTAFSKSVVVFSLSDDEVGVTGVVLSDFCDGDKKKNKFKKPLFFSSVFFASKHTSPRQTEKGILYTSEEIYTLHRRKKKVSEKESESSAKRVLFVLYSVCFFFPSSF